MQETPEELIRRIHREEVERAWREGGLPIPHREPPTLHYSELPEANPDSPLFVEWNTYRREVGRRRAEGQEGRFVLIKGEQILGLFESQEDARGHGYRTFHNQPFLVHQLREREPLFRCLSVCLCHK